MKLIDFCYPLDENYKGVASGGRPPHTPGRVYRIMQQYGIETAEEIADLNPIQLMMMRGVGMKTIDWIETRLEECGLATWMH